MSDLFAPAYSTLVIATKSRTRYWDGDAVRTPTMTKTCSCCDSGWEHSQKYSGNASTATKAGNDARQDSGVPRSPDHPAGAPLLDWWDVPAETVAERLTLSMCPKRVCRTCGEPSMRIVGAPEYVPSATYRGGVLVADAERVADGANQWRNGDGAQASVVRSTETLGWSDCGHDDWRPGLAFDPFAKDDMTAKYLVADVFDGIATLADDSVDLIVTSPPFLALRSYLPADHEHKGKELGSEPTPGAFIDRLLDVVEACARVLAPHGSLVFELGDTYAGNERGADVADWSSRNGFSDNHTGRSVGTMPRRERGAGWPLNKSKVLIPQLFAIALAYGFNPLTGRQTEPWRVRNTVAWCRPNPPVGRDGDKFRPATSFLTVACKARDRFWDGDAVRTPAQQPKPAGDRSDRRTRVEMAADGKGDPGHHGAHPAGAPLLDYWIIPTHPFKGAHYATWSPQLVVPLVKSMCPARVCRVCGKPSTRIVETRHVWEDGTPKDSPVPYTTGAVRAEQARGYDGRTVKTTAIGHGNGKFAITDTLGWSDCGHDDYRSGLILDPFAGSGTTLAVASGHGFDCIGIDLDERNADLAQQRVGMFLEVECGAPSPKRDAK